MNSEDLEISWKPGTICLAVLCSVVSAYSAVSILDNARWTARKHESHTVIYLRKTNSAAAVVLGCGGVWSMHQVGNMAFVLEDVDIETNVLLTLLSILAIVAFTHKAFSIAGADVFAGSDRLEVLRSILLDKYTLHELKLQPTIGSRVAFFWRLQHICLAAVVMAVGVATMHFAGMFALNGAFHVRLSIWRVFLVVVAAIIVCFVGLWILFRLLLWRPTKEIYRPVAGLIIGMAVCCVHFFGMHSATYTRKGTDESPLPLGSISVKLTKGEYLPFIIFFVMSLALLTHAGIATQLRKAYRKLEDTKLGINIFSDRLFNGSSAISSSESALRRQQQQDTSDVVSLQESKDGMHEPIHKMGIRCNKIIAQPDEQGDI